MNVLYKPTVDFYLQSIGDNARRRAPQMHLRRVCTALLYDGLPTALEVI